MLHRWAPRGGWVLDSRALLVGASRLVGSSVAGDVFVDAVIMYM